VSAFRFHVQQFISLCQDEGEYIASQPRYCSLSLSPLSHSLLSRSHTCDRGKYFSRGWHRDKLRGKAANPWGGWGGKVLHLMKPKANTFPNQGLFYVSKTARNLNSTIEIKWLQETLNHKGRTVVRKHSMQHIGLTLQARRATYPRKALLRQCSSVEHVRKGRHGGREGWPVFARPAVKIYFPRLTYMDGTT
jgi:hypothetical protein